jgi:hypothetical protein
MISMTLAKKLVATKSSAGSYLSKSGIPGILLGIVLWICTALRVGLFVVASVIAAAWIGYVVGWLIGASRSPIAHSIAPLVFGLLAAIGVGVGLRTTLQTRLAMWRGTLVAALAAIFCYFCYIGVTWGNQSRIGPYKAMGTLLGDAWSSVDPDTAAALYKFRLQAKGAGVPFDDFESIMVDVIRPIIEAGHEDELARVQKSLDAIEPAIAAYQVDQKPAE